MATTPAHTPGPWTAERVYQTRNEPDMRVVKNDAHGNIELLIADTRHSEDPKYTCFVQKVEEMRANAHLIAAAPEMFQALESVFDITNEEHFTRSADSKLYEIRSIVRLALKTAIEHTEV